MKLNRKQRREWAAYRQEPELDKEGGLTAPTKRGMLRTLRREKLALTTCRRKGHAWVDFDHGDPEHGPNPDISCARCGLEG